MFVVHDLNFAIYWPYGYCKFLLPNIEAYSDVISSIPSPLPKSKFYEIGRQNEEKTKGKVGLGGGGWAKMFIVYKIFDWGREK